MDFPEPGRPQERGGEGTAFVSPWPYRRMNSATPDPLAGSLLLSGDCSNLFNEKVFVSGVAKLGLWGGGRRRQGCAPDDS